MSADKAPSADEVLQLEALAHGLALPTETSRPRRQQIARLLLRQHRHLGQRIAEEIAEAACARWSKPREALAELAERLISWQDGHPASNSRPELRTVRRLVDEDALLAARIAWADGVRLAPVDPWSLALEPLPPSLDRDLDELLDQPLAEIHLHLWGAIPPIADWLPLMLDLVSIWEKGHLLAQAARDEDLEAGQLAELREAWVARLAEAALLRLWMAAAIREQAGRDHPFYRVHKLPESADLEDGIRRSERRRDDPQNSADLLDDLRQALARIGHAQPRDRSAAAIEGCPIWLDPTGPCPYRDPLSQAALLAMDAVPPQDAFALGERFLLAEALRLLRAPRRHLATDPIARLEPRLFRYLEIKLAMIRLLFFHKGSRGLDRFHGTFARRDQRWRFGGHRARQVWSLANERYWTHLVCRRWLVASTALPLTAGQRRPRHHAADLAKVARLYQAKIARLERKLELRVSPPLGADFSRRLHAQVRGLHDALEGLSEAGHQARGMTENDLPALPRLSLGFIFHLKKSPDTKPDVHAERFGQIVAWLRDHPAYRPLVVGVDAAGKELDQDASDFLPAFRRLQTELDRPADTYQVPIMLGRTFHVGEDFRDLLTGIRQVDVVQRLLGFKAGDRFGHALALGWSPELWYQRRQGMSVVHLGDHLLDLLWARYALVDESRADTTYLQIVKAYLERFGLQKGSGTAKKAARKWFEQSLISDPQKPFLTEATVQKSLVGALGETDPKQLHTIRVEPQWIELVSKLQQLVARRVAAAGITIEANPTSNLAIGDLLSFAELPLLQQHPVRPDPASPWPALRVAVSTDDPGLFNSGLREELDMLFTAGCQSCARDEMLSWIDRLRKTGFQSSFLRGPAVPGERFRDYLYEVVSGNALISPR